jgi:hypothetical protein
MMVLLLFLKLKAGADTHTCTHTSHTHTKTRCQTAVKRLHKCAEANRKTLFDAQDALALKLVADTAASAALAPNNAIATDAAAAAAAAAKPKRRPPLCADDLFPLIVWVVTHAGAGSGNTVATDSAGVYGGVGVGGGGVSGGDVGLKHIHWSIGHLERFLSDNQVRVITLVAIKFKFGLVSEVHVR